MSRWLAFVKKLWQDLTIRTGSKKDYIKNSEIAKSINGLIKFPRDYIYIPTSQTSNTATTTRIIKQDRHKIQHTIYSGTLIFSSCCFIDETFFQLWKPRYSIVCRSFYNTAYFFVWARFRKIEILFPDEKPWRLNARFRAFTG